MTGAAKIFYIMGASCSGKDSVMDRCRLYLKAEHRCLVAHRYITRPAQAGGENHVELSLQEFQQRVEMNGFAMHWEANGYWYGIGCELYHWLGNGYHVLLNGSRAYLPEAIQLYKDVLIPVYLTITPATLKNRLIERGRESATAIEQRVKRAKDYSLVNDESCMVLDNNGELDHTVNALMEIIESYCPQILVS